MSRHGGLPSVDAVITATAPHRRYGDKGAAADLPSEVFDRWVSGGASAAFAVITPAVARVRSPDVTPDPGKGMK